MYRSWDDQRCIEHQGEGILELRKEKSRDAARSRRGKENYEFYELAKLLPLPMAITSQLDKASIVRLSISYLKLRDFGSQGDPPWNRAGPPPNKSVKGGPPRRRSMANLAVEIFEQHHGAHILQSTDGFLFTLGNDGRFLYISETVSVYLGLSQVEMSGSSIFEYVHPQDQSEVAEHLGIPWPQSQSLASPSALSDEGSNHSSGAGDRLPVMSNSPPRGYDVHFTVRMKSTLTKRGVHVKSSGYRVILIFGHLRPQFNFSHSRRQPPMLLGFVGVGVALPPPAVHEIRMENDMFVMRLTLDNKITHCEQRISELMDLVPEDLVNHSLYSYVHAQDLPSLRKSHIDLIQKGQTMTDYYRLLNKHGGYVWLQTCTTLMINSKNPDDQNVIAINYVISGVEYPSCAMSIDQTGQYMEREESSSHPDASIKYDRTATSIERDCYSKSPGQKEEKDQQSNQSKHIATESIKKKDINVSETEDTAIKASTPVNPSNSEQSIENGVKELNYSAESRHSISSRKRKLSNDSDIMPASPTRECRKQASVDRSSVLSPQVIGVSELISSPDTRSPDQAQDLSTSANATSSVKELENVLNKHLPSDTSGQSEPSNCFQDKSSNKSGMHRISNQSSNSMGLPASHLLRHLYTNRQSVIRSSRPCFYDMQGTLPTPPGAEGYYDSSVYIPKSSGSEHLIYGSTATYPDAYSITPPSSVSPTEKLSHGVLPDGHYDARHYASDAPTTAHLQHFPLKPQLYMHPMSIGLDQYSTHLTPEHYTHTSGFHIYHPTMISKASDLDHPSSSNWYSQSGN